MWPEVKTYIIAIILIKAIGYSCQSSGPFNHTDVIYWCCNSNP